LKNIKQLAKDAIDVQYACNLLGVSKSFAKAVDELYESNDCKGMKECFEHPIITLWLNKMCQLNGCQYEMRNKVITAFCEVDDMAKD